MRQKILILLQLLLLIQDSRQIIRDASFIKFCDNVAGQLSQLSQPQQQTTTLSLQYSRGDTCIVVWPVPAETQKEAEEYCHLWNMYPIAEAKLTAQGNPECKYENVFECRPDYTLFKGHCYKMVTNKFVTYDEAKKLCSNEKVTSILDSSKKLSVEVVKMYEQDLIRFFKAYFTDMGMFFIQNIPEMISNLKIEYMGDGDNYALAFGLAPVYKTGQGAVIRLPKNTLARVMCAYEPEETALSLSYKARKLAPYYYPTSDNGQVWRTAGLVGIQDTEYEFASPSQACEMSMRALVGKQKGDAWDATIVNIQSLDATLKLAIVQSILSYSWCCEVYNRGYDESFYSCPSWESWLQEGIIYRTIYNYAQKCVDGTFIDSSTHAMNSHARGTYFFYPTKVEGYNNLKSSNSYMRAPALCNLHYFVPSKPKQCEQNWTPFKRTNGLTVCHRVFFNEERTFDNALDFCHRQGGTLATFTTNDEYKLIMKLINNRNDGVWLGYRKKSECPLIKSYGRCTSSYIFEFVDPLFGDDTTSARNVMSTKWLSGEPNNQKNAEHCIHKWNYGSGSGPLLNDIFCSDRYAPACIKPQT